MRVCPVTIMDFHPPNEYRRTRVVNRLRSRPGQVTELFRQFDRDGNGIITALELKTVMENLGESISDDELAEMI